MKVYTLTGKSGTGKSYQAINLCKEKQIESIIDDGLFIYHNRVEAGKSAKRQKTMVGAIKTALFTDDDHATSVQERIETLKPSSILIIGTSTKMTDKIVARLKLPQVTERIYIEDITSEAEREAAGRQRKTQGKHVIPVPTLQLKRDFAGYFLDPLRIIKNIGGKGSQLSEKTVVRPTFSYMGEFFISDTVLTDIATCVAEELPEIAGVGKVYENTHPDNLIMEVEVYVKHTRGIWEAAMEFQERLAKIVESMTAFNVAQINIEVKLDHSTYK
ncbi:putative alkaline shock family protein YloU [Clostridiales Family XIII bacterium PM5-7]